MDKRSLVLLAKSKLKDPYVDGWEKDIYSFVLDWFSDTDQINVSTSGSTGRPKKIVLKKSHMAKSARITLDFLKLKEGDKALLCLPVNYIAGKMMIIRAFVGGLGLHYVKPSLHPDFSLYDTFDLIALVPSMLSETIKRGKAHDLERFNKILLGGSAVPFEMEKALKGLQSYIWHSYGMTETITHIALRSINGKHASDWFTPLPGVKVSVSDDSTLKINYEKIGVADLMTNDIAEMDQKGNFIILGRKDNVIISGGLKIHIEEVEKKIERIINCDFIIYGLEDKHLGQKAVIFIEGRSNIPDSQALLEMKKMIPKAYFPKDIIVIDEFDRTASGKIIRKNYVS
ncbi:MAG: AMP-binding protein [Bacteroidota bacterium]